MKKDDPFFQQIVAFDVETTGLNPSRDEIIEVGLVRMDRGEITDRLSLLVDPGCAIPPFITRLTGITQKDVAGQPFLRDVLPQITRFMGDDPLVMHNADFDMGFLRQGLRRHLPDASSISPGRILDTLDLARFLLPWLPNHRLETVAAYLNVDVAPTHRASDDAEATALVLHEMMTLAADLDSDCLRGAMRLMEKSRSGLFRLLEHFSRQAKKREKPAPDNRRHPVNILGKPQIGTEEKPLQRLDEAEIDEWMGETGELARFIDGFEYRQPQWDMARAVAGALNQDQILVAEAGTGVGKSLAYLTPLLLWMRQNPHSRGIISTHTKTLQDQLFSKELPLLFEAMQGGFLATLLKGRANYLCLRRWEYLIYHGIQRLNASQRRRLLPLIRWATETRTGDIEENAGFHRERNQDVWSQIQSDGAHCFGSRCTHEKRCFFQRIRRASRQANVVVVNHPLLFSDLAMGHTVLGAYDTLIVDEAHQMERVASQSLGRALNFWMFRDAAQRIFQSGRNEQGIVAELRNSLRFNAQDAAIFDDLMRVLDTLEDGAQALAESARDFFSRLSETLPRQRNQLYFKHRIRDNVAFFEPLDEEFRNITRVLSEIEKDLNRATSLLLEWDSSPDSVLEAQGRELESLEERCQELKALLADFCSRPLEAHVVWCEMEKKMDRDEISLYAVPLDIPDILNERLYPHPHRCVLTSATLTVAGRFDYILGRLGLDQMNHETLSARHFGSPFDYPSQALLLAPRFLPHPSSGDFSAAVAQLTESVLAVHERGTMALFTSHKMLKEVYRALQPALRQRHVSLLGQGMDGSRSTLLRLFQDDPRSVLLGTSSFWEGVDVPGSALEVLIITKLPFDVPTDPLVEARTEQVESQTGSGFINYSVPEAVVRLRQGFGRLIRSGRDRGVVLILDSRVTSTRYGKLFLRSLPVEARQPATEQELMKELENWFQ